MKPVQEEESNPHQQILSEINQTPQQEYGSSSQNHGNAVSHFQSPPFTKQHEKEIQTSEKSDQAAMKYD
jgi:hypothetical protein